MKRVKKSWMAVVMGALLLGTLVGVVWARPNDRPGAQDITRKVTLTGGDFIPQDDAPAGEELPRDGLRQVLPENLPTRQVDAEHLGHEGHAIA